MKVTRPKPTIYGNCDSWNFIVGKTRRAYSLEVTPTRPLQASNSHLVHSFSTIVGGGVRNNMWAACGSAAPAPQTIPHRGGATCRYAANGPSSPPILPNPVLSLGHKLASANRFHPGSAFVKAGAACLFLTIPQMESPKPEQGLGLSAGGARVSRARGGSAGSSPSRHGAGAPARSCSCPPSPSRPRIRARC